MDTPPPSGPHGPALRLLGAASRLVMVVAVAATFATSLALLARGAATTWDFVRALLLDDAPLSDTDAFVRAIKILDLFLLATVVQVVSLGIVQLYFGTHAGWPAWLRVRSIDDLKAKLVTVTVTVLGVYFLGEAVAWGGGPDILYLGLAVAAVVGALSYFLATVRAPKD